MFNFEKIFNKKEKEAHVVDAVELKQEPVSEKKTLEYYEEKKEELKNLYQKRSEEAVQYQNTKDRIDALGPNDTLKNSLLEEAHASTLGKVNKEIQSISEEGIGLNSKEHYQAREQMLQDELTRVNEKIEAFRQEVIYPENENAQKLLSLKERIEESWNENIPQEEGYKILVDIFGENNVYERTYTKIPEISQEELIKAIDDRLSKIADTFTGSGELNTEEYKLMVHRKEKLNELLANWYFQNRK